MISKFQDELFTNISHVIAFKNLPKDIYGVAMNLFHYYTYFKSFRVIDREELSLTCVLLAYKIRHGFIKLEDTNVLYNHLKSINKGKSSGNSGSNAKSANKTSPNLVNVEMELLNFLGYDLEIELPFVYLSSLRRKFNFSNKTENLIINMINDSYRRPLCVFFHPRTIALAITFVAMNALSEDNFLMNIYAFIKNDMEYIKDEFLPCVEILLNLLESKMNKD